MDAEKSCNAATPKKKSRLAWGILIALDAGLLCFFAFLLYSAAQARLKSGPVYLEKPSVTAGLPPAPPEQPPQPAMEQSTETLTAAPAVQQSTAPAIPEIAAEPQLIQSTGAVAQEPPAASTKQPTAKTVVAAKSFRVKLRYRDSKAKAVAVRGSFSADPVRMSRKGAEWAAELFLKTGIYRYVLEVDGKQLQDPLQPLRLNGKSLLVVKN
jgi:hypothetical protein